MRHLTLALLILSLLGGCNDSDPKNRPSPLVMDSLVMNNVVLKTIYSSPSVRKRKIWGELVPFNQIWRTGANDASIVSISADIILSGQLLPKGKYSLFSVPGEQEWELIFNKEWSQWGSYNYNAEKDQLRITVTPIEMRKNQERMSIQFDSTDFMLRWEYLELSLPYRLKD